MKICVQNPDPYSSKILDPDPYQDHYGSETLMETAAHN